MVWSGNLYTYGTHTNQNLATSQSESDDSWWDAWSQSNVVKSVLIFPVLCLIWRPLRTKVVVFTVPPVVMILIFLACAFILKAYSSYCFSFLNTAVCSSDRWCISYLLQVCKIKKRNMTCSVTTQQKWIWNFRVKHFRVDFYRSILLP